MVTHMKTTIEISDSLFEQARKSAAREGTTLRSLVERGLRLALKPDQPAKEFRLRKASFRGRGMQRGAEEGNWGAIRDAAYEGRGA